MRDDEIVVFELVSRGEGKCDECGRALFKGNFVRKEGERVHSKRIGRTAGAKDFDPTAIDLAVQAYVRHRHTVYDDLMAAGVESLDARAQVRAAIDLTLRQGRAVA